VQVKTCTDMSLLRTSHVAPFKQRDKIIPGTSWPLLAHPSSWRLIVMFANHVLSVMIFNLCPECTVYLLRLTAARLVKKFSDFMEQKCPLSWRKKCEIYFNFNLSSTHKSPNVSLPFKFPPKIPHAFISSPICVLHPRFISSSYV